jgi:processive 1,2-diacylglycerol beta-glucosyltransferase
MTREPRVLIVSASIGSGHDQAAFAIEEQLRRQYPQIHVDIVDFLAYGGAWGSFVKETYFKMLHVFPDMYDYLYRWTSGRGQRVKNLLAYSSKKRMQKLYQQYQPDILVFTHPFPCAAAAYLRRKRLLETPLVAVVTDYAVHPLWIYDEVDIYCIADQVLVQQLIDKGIAEQRILVSGIPINSRFSEQQINVGLYRQLGLRLNEPVVMLMGGGLGLGPLEEVLASIEYFATKLQMIVVAGNNAEIIPSLEARAKESRHDIRVLGFTNEIDSLMDMAHLLITKPGGLTTSEALAKKLPMLLLLAIPGQEEENARFLVRQGTAIRVHDVDAIPRYLHRLLVKRPDMLQSVKQAAERLAKPEAAAYIAQVVLRLVKRFAGRQTIG